jgi:RAB protein geranylgeranyltransferase component A
MSIKKHPKRYEFTVIVFANDETVPNLIRMEVLAFLETLKLNGKFVSGQTIISYPEDKTQPAKRQPR